MKYITLIPTVVVDIFHVLDTNFFDIFWSLESNKTRVPGNQIIASLLTLL